MFDLEKLAESEKARNRFLTWMGAGFVLLFVGLNLLLGFDGLTRVDHFITDVTGNMVNRPWMKLQEKYGGGLATFAYLVKARCLGFVSLEMVVSCGVFCWPLMKNKFLTIFPGRKDDIKSMIEQGDLRSVRGYSWAEQMRQVYFLGLSAATLEDPPRTGVRWMLLTFLAVYAVEIAFVLYLPISEHLDPLGWRRALRPSPEVDFAFLLMVAGSLIFAGPYFVVTLLRWIKPGSTSRQID